MTRYIYFEEYVKHASPIAPYGVTMKRERTRKKSRRILVFYQEVTRALISSPVRWMWSQLYPWDRNWVSLLATAMFAMLNALITIVILR